MDGKQRSFSSATFDHYAKTTKRAVFLDEMNRIMPWERLRKLVETVYPKGEVGRPPIELERMLASTSYSSGTTSVIPALKRRLTTAPRCSALSASTWIAPIPDETTICKFRHLLEKHGLGEKIFAEVNAYLRENGVELASGAIVDATIIQGAPQFDQGTRPRSVTQR